jgi:hypothetical protein
MRQAKDQIIRRIQRWGPGAVFTPKDFLDLTSRGSVDMALGALLKDGTIRRVIRGVYDLPRTNQALGGQLSPDIDQAAWAIARRFRWHVIPSGASAANMLGLSTQVPAKIVYLSDGPTRSIRIGRQILYFKHARPTQTRIETPTSGIVIQALRHLGKTAVDPDIIGRLRARLSASEKRHLLRDARYSSDWVFAAARRIAEGAE